MESRKNWQSSESKKVTQCESTAILNKIQILDQIQTGFSQ